MNKNFEILVSCSDKEKNCTQAHEIACKLIELHVSSFWNILEHYAYRVSQKKCSLVFKCL